MTPTQFEITESSEQSGSPVEGYRFTGTFKTYFYTSAEADVTINGQLYLATPGIKRDAVRSGSQNDDGLDLQVTVPFDLDIVKDYGLQISPPDLVLEIFRFHAGDNPATDFAVIWKGPVMSFSITGHEAKMRVPSIFAVALQGEIPNVYWHNPCNHVLYDARCQVVKDALTQKFTTVSSITDETTIVVADDGFADTVLQAGEMINTTKGERRLIIDNVADLITIAFPFFKIEVGDAIELLVGCNHQFTTCKVKFSNAPQYGGFPFIPNDNPFQFEL